MDFFTYYNKFNFSQLTKKNGIFLGISDWESQEKSVSCLMSKAFVLAGNSWCCSLGGTNNLLVYYFVYSLIQ